jgi:hypothetical protein
VRHGEERNNTVASTPPNSFAETQRSLNGIREIPGVCRLGINAFVPNYFGQSPGACDDRDTPSSHGLSHAETKALVKTRLNVYGGASVPLAKMLVWDIS